MQELTIADDVPLSAQAVWDVIGDFSAIRKWAGAVEAESTEITPKGKVRTLTMPGGRVIQELMTEEGDFFYSYTLERPDMEAYVSTVSVAPAGEAASRIVLTIRFAPKDPSALEAATEQLTKFCRGNIKAMKRALGVG